MSTFAEKKAAALAAKRPHRDVTVTLDIGLSEERTALIKAHSALTDEREAILKSDDRRLTSVPDTTDVDKRIAAIDKKVMALAKREAGTLVTLRFYKVPGDEWADLTATHPIRENSTLDRRFGYNMHGVCRASAVTYGRVLDGDIELEQSEAEWDEIWHLLGGSEFSDVANAIYNQNEFEPAQRLERLKNFSEAATASAKK